MERVLVLRPLFIEYSLPYLINDADFPSGGWAVELLTWLVGFDANGVRTGVVTKISSTNSSTQCPTELLRVYSPRKIIPGASYIVKFLPNLFLAAFRFKPNVVVQAVAGSNTALMWVLSRTLRVPFVYRCANDIDVDKRVHQRLSRVEAALFKFGFAHADAIVAQNNYQLEAVQRRFPGKPSIQLYNPFQMRQEERRVRADRTYVAWLGIFQPQKNLPLLAEIAASLPHIEFRVGGRREINMSDAATEAALAALEGMPNVTFVGFLKRTQVPRFVSGSILLLNTSLYEGFSNTFLEAWNAGTPVIAPSNVDPDGLISKKGLGRSAEGRKGLVEAIEDIVSLGRFDYANLSELCRNHVEAEHDPKRLAKRFADFVNTIPRR